MKMIKIKKYQKILLACILTNLSFNGKEVLAFGVNRERRAYEYVNWEKIHWKKNF